MWRLHFGLTMMSAACLAPSAAAQTLPPPSATAARLNTTGRVLHINAPLLMRDALLGEVVMQVAPDDTIALPTERVLLLLSEVVEPKTMEALNAALGDFPALSPGDLAGTGVSIRYDPLTLSLILTVPDTLRIARSVSLGAIGDAPAGSFDEPAAFSAYLNSQIAWDHVWRGEEEGFGDATVFLDGAARLGGVVLESEGIWQPGARGSDFHRHGTRLVYDDTGSVIRWTAGDLQPTGLGFQGVIPISGISLERSYGVLQPHQTVRPTGRQSFLLRRPSTVEVLVNGQIVRRMRLEPGPYDLADFPTGYGANDVQLVITEDTGRIETLRFDLFFDQDQLARGLSEFALYAGVRAPRRFSGVDYSNDWALSGYYRRGVTDYLTLGGNVQAVSGDAMVGAEAIWAPGFGIFAGHIAASRRSSGSKGVAGIVSFRREFPGTAGWGGTLNLTAELWSKNFSVPRGTPSDIPFRHRIGASYSQSFGESLYAAIHVQHAKQRAPGVPDPLMVRGSFGWRISRTVNLTGDFFHQRHVSTLGHETGARINLTVRLGARSSIQAGYDTAYRSTRASYQTSGGEGVGSYSAGVDVERSPSGTNLNGNLAYTSNRAEFAVSHLSSFGALFDLPRDSRTHFRIASSLAFADGAFAIGRPVQDSFAIVKGHSSLRGAQVIVDPSGESYTASTGTLGAALKPNLSSYSERNVTIDAPEAPLGIDLGRGAFRTFPPYRSGYRLQVGSDYFISASGRMLQRDGEPLSLVAGSATELSEPEREPIQLFTNRAGRFALSGLRPGRWRIDMLSSPPLTYFIDVPADASEIVALGELTPETEAR